MGKMKMPSEEEVRRLFQESYYVTHRFDSETSRTKTSSMDKINFIYPSKRKEDVS